MPYYEPQEAFSAICAQAKHAQVEPVAGIGGFNPEIRSGKLVTSGEVIRMFP